MTQTEEMNKAAGLAEKDLDTLDEKSVAEVRGWFLKHIGKAGYKRLAKIMAGKETYTEHV